ncbi:MAG: hypothetical protein LBR80_02615, partial [Deltaproteobacteria bacterium]|nr:hypothetical protein [Deltaproteobacteria bacterium]
MTPEEPPGGEVALPGPAEGTASALPAPEVPERPEGPSTAKAPGLAEPPDSGDTEVPEAAETPEITEDGEAVPTEAPRTRSPGANGGGKKKGRLKRMLLYTLVAVVALAALLFCGGFLYLRSERFGALPEGERLARIERSPNWRDGAFRNLEPAKDTSRDSPRGRFDFFFRGDRTAPKDPLPVVETDLRALPDGEFVWFGHSSFLIRLGGRIFLVDPVLAEG